MTGIRFGALLIAAAFCAAADVPQFQYVVRGKIADILRSEQSFRPLAAQVRTARALSNLTTRAMLDASRFPKDSSDYRAAIYASIRGTLDAMPFDVIQKDVRALKERLDLPVNETQLIGQLSATLDPLIEKNGSLPSGVVHGLPGLRFSLLYELPVRPILSEALGTYLAGHAASR